MTSDKKGAEQVAARLSDLEKERIIGWQGPPGAAYNAISEDLCRVGLLKPDWSLSPLGLAVREILTNSLGVPDSGLMAQPDNPFAVRGLVPDTPTIEAWNARHQPQREAVLEEVVRTFAEGLWAEARKRGEMRPEFMPSSRTDFLDEARKQLTALKATPAPAEPTPVGDVVSRDEM